MKKLRSEELRADFSFPKEDVLLNCATPLRAFSFWRKVVGSREVTLEL